MSLEVGTTLMMGKHYLPSLVGDIVRVTPTLYILRLDDGKECRVRKDTMRVVGGDLQTFRKVDADDVASGREQYRRDRAMMEALSRALQALSATTKDIWDKKLVWRKMEDIEDAIRRKSTVDITMATAQINECVATLRKLNGEEV